ncbi:MAG: cobyric acid synthase [Desulfobacteraceae bacterium]|nr:cobyric acid synthase [Desulfobacteraceae bacterium]MBC2754034.1 cobyric acid synthase [Desulfobacteraceae bacterium]
MKKKAPCIAVLGTGSDVGKSIVVTALCRIFYQMGVSVAPFKAQNMSNNSGVTPEGLEMGRAQIVQAEAANLIPSVDMNPVLLKPSGKSGSQVVLFGKALGNQSAAAYHKNNDSLFHAAGSTLDRLRDAYDLVVMEGAGSCAEVNLMENDIVNLPMARYADADVILVSDIDKGGVFAQIVGTLACLPEHFRKMVKGFIINRFRGDKRLFEDGVQWIEEKTNIPVIGVIPWFNDIKIDDEDSVAIENTDNFFGQNKRDLPRIAVLRLPYISNFTDINPLKQLKGIQVLYVETPRDLKGFKAVIIPGSKNTRNDLVWLKQTGWTAYLQSYAENGGHLLGICGGFQMLGKFVDDPDGLEEDPGRSIGLGLLDVETVLKAPKITTLSLFSWSGGQGLGYEIHMGQTKRLSGSPMLNVCKRNGVACNDKDGCVSENKRVMGTYMHGFFDTPDMLKKWLEHIGVKSVEVPDVYGLNARNREYDRLADHVRANVDMEKILNLRKS